MQMKSTLICYFTPVKGSVSKIPNKTTPAEGVQKRNVFTNCCGEQALMQPLWEELSQEVQH